MISKIKNKIRIDFDKNTKLVFYIKGLLTLITPKFLYNKENIINKYTKLSSDEKEYIQNRIKYYNKIENRFKLKQDAQTIQEFISNTKKTTYYFDLLEYLKYFDFSHKISFLFGDIVTVPTTPAFVKSRPIYGDNKNSILMKLNKVRHFIFVNDEIRFEDKKDMLVWRGKVNNEHRVNFIKQYHNSSLCNAGAINKSQLIDDSWLKDKLTLKKHFEYKFILSIEGHDVATNLKWAMSSNSLVFMVKPKYETWFMEGTLKENFHYVLIDDDYSDLEDKIKYYSHNIDKALKIINNAHEYVEQFKNKDREDIISILVLEKYFRDSLL